MSQNFRDLVANQVEKLKHNTCHEIQNASMRKRRAWFEGAGRQFLRDSPISPRQAYKILFFDYMGLQLEELPIVTESDTEVRWLSKNPCFTLEACLELGLDTKIICRAAYEKSTQSFLSKLDPQLRFHRSYEHIRPYAADCLEWIVRVDFGAMLSLVKQTGGALVTFGQETFSRADETAEGRQGGGEHAATHAIRLAVEKLSPQDLCGAVLFLTKMPCPECTAKVVRANLTSIVISDAGGKVDCGGKRATLQGVRKIIENSGTWVEVIAWKPADPGLSSDLLQSCEENQ